MTVWLALSVAQASPALLVEPLEFRRSNDDVIRVAPGAGVQLPLGGRFQLDVLAKPDISVRVQRDRLDVVGESGAPVNSSAITMGVAVAVIGRHRFSASRSGFTWATGLQGATRRTAPQSSEPTTEAAAELGAARTLDGRLWTGPGGVVSLGERWTLGVDTEFVTLSAGRTRQSQSFNGIVVAETLNEFAAVEVMSGIRLWVSFGAPL